MGQASGLVAEVVAHDVLEINAVEVAPPFLGAFPDGLKHFWPQRLRRVALYHIQSAAAVLLIGGNVRGEEAHLVRGEPIVVSERWHDAGTDLVELRFHADVEAGDRLLPGPPITEEKEPVAQ